MNITGNKFTQLAIIVACGAALSACSTVGGGNTYVRANQQGLGLSSFDGDWQDTRGLFNASFSQGKFESVSPQTGDRLAAGSYVPTGTTGIILDFATSRGSRENAVCKLSTIEYMTCKPTNGSEFSMRRMQNSSPQPAFSS